MKKYLIFILLILLISCEKDLLEPLPDPTTNLVFDVEQTSVVDGQDISFEIITNEQHQLIITTQEGSVITKEKFQPQVEINTRKIYTKSLPSGTYNLILVNNVDELNKTTITID